MVVVVVVEIWWRCNRGKHIWLPNHDPGLPPPSPALPRVDTLHTHKEDKPWPGSRIFPHFACLHTVVHISP